MKLEELIEEVKEKVRKERDRDVGSNVFQNASYDSKKVVKILANEHSIFPFGALVKLLKTYRIDRNKLFYRKMVKEEMDYVNENNEEFRIIRTRMGNANRIFLPKKEVKYMLKHFYEKELIINYKKKNLVEDLKEATAKL